LVDVYLSKSFTGTPFTGGIFKPYICIPFTTYKRLTEKEINAVIAHELGHIRQFDIVFTMFIQALGDIFWFIPGYRWLCRKIDRTREIVADQYAVKNGISGEFLASALLKLKELPDCGNKFILYSALTLEKSLLKTRIGRLLGDLIDKKERLGWRYLGVRWAVTFCIIGTVMNSTLAGNYEAQFSDPSGLLKFIIDYLTRKP
jgi:beta-lactamase regulating signal transducer with metallopeptidase domain